MALSPSSGRAFCYFLDENIDQRIVPSLLEKEIQVHTVEQAELKGERDDALILAKATELGCVLVTSDDDLFEINQQINERWLEDESSTHAGIVFISYPRSPGKLIEQLVELAREKSPEDMQNLLLII